MTKMTMNGRHPDRNDPGLAGKVAVITGGGKGIGGAVARRLAGLGAAITLTYNSSENEAKALARELRREGAEVAVSKVNVGEAGAIEKLVAEVLDRSSRVDILINNAGIAWANAVEDWSPARLDEMIAVNVRAPFIAIHEAIEHMPPGGRIINIGSISSEYMPYSGHSAYVMTKAALTGLTRGLAREIAARGITINTVLPGRVDTDLLHDVLGDRFDVVRRATPLGRFGDADEVASLVAYLCSSEAGYITGTAVRIDGGVSV